MATATSKGMMSLEELTMAGRAIQEEKMLLRAQHKLMHTRFGEKRPLAPNEGSSVIFTVMTNLSAATTALDEGVTPAGESFTLTTKTITPLYYGSFAYITRRMEDMGIYQIVNDATDALGYQAGLTADTLCRDALSGYGTTQNCDGVSEASLAATNVLELDEIFNAVRQLENYGALGLPELGGRFACIVHPDSKYDLMRDSEFRALYLNAMSSRDDNPIFGNIMVDVSNVRFFETGNAKVNSNVSGTVDSYDTLVIGMQAYGVGGLVGHIEPYSEAGTGVAIRPVQLIVHGREDYPPLNLKSSVGWLINQGQTVLQSTFMIRIIHACSKGTNA